MRNVIMMYGVGRMPQEDDIPYKTTFYPSCPCDKYDKLLQENIKLKNDIKVLEIGQNKGGK